MSDQINTAIGERPDLEWVDVELIDVDHNYQRDVDGQRVSKILKTFRWDHFGAVVLARKPDGRFHVTDGQHRCKAAKLHPNVTHVPALIMKGEGMEAEAENFLVINRARKAVSPVDTYWAGIAAGNADDLRLRDVLASAGCDVVAGNANYKPGHTGAVAALRRCIERYGDGATIAALKVIRDAWPTDALALRGILISAIARLIRNNKQIDRDRLVRVLAPKSFAEMTAAAEAFRKISGGSSETVLSKAITELYNKHLQTNQILIGVAA
jgi:hypothetical protein